MSNRNPLAPPPRRTPPPQNTMRRTSADGDYEPNQSMWVGWIAFGATMMMLLGSFHAIEGFIALFQDGYFVAREKDLVVNVDYTTWGVVHLIAGTIVALAGGALFTGRVWARTVGAACVFVSALVNIAFLSAYPVWSMIMITLDVLVLWAVIVHGGELRDSDKYTY
jgi:hypothetical protein